MRSFESCRSRVPARLAVLAAAAFVAGCSSDASRFSDTSFSNPFGSRSEVTGSSQQSQAPQQMPSQHVERRELPPPAAPKYSSAPPPGQSSDWNWNGGTAVTVAPGDSIASIARKYDVPAAVIIQANHLPPGATVHAGQHLVIPRYTPHGNNTRTAFGAKPTDGVHVVAAGENLSSIAHKYHRPRAAIAKANNLAPDAPIRVGQRLVIPGAKPAPPGKLAAGPAGVQQGSDTKVGVAPPPVQQEKREKIASNDPPAKAHMTTPSDQSIESESGVTGEPASGTPSFRWPVRGRIITGFGPRGGGGQNDGINLAVPEGTSIKAAEDGVVAYAGSELKGYGNLVLVRHNNGYVTAYAHASELLVKRGDQVKRGQIIGRAGQTGSVSAPQLHFEIRKGKVPVDPTQYLPST